MSSCKRICFTINNYTDDDIRRIGCLGATYLAYAKEVGDNGTPHIQGYAEFKSSRRFTTLKKIIPRAHYEKANGTYKENVGYALKDGVDCVVEGIPKQQGARHDLDNVFALIKDGATVDEITISNPVLFHQYGRTLSKLEDLAMRQKFRSEMTTCDWIYGPTGAGKSHSAFSGFSPATHYVWKNDNGWQDGYTQQPTVIINDFRGEIPYNELLQMIDKWPYYVKRRGREPMPFTSKHIIITSSLPPDAIYHRRLEEDHIEQLIRRLRLVQCDTPAAEVVKGNTIL